MSDYVLVGRFGKVHGVRGWISVHSFTDPQENLFRYTPWYVRTSGSFSVLHQQQADVRHAKKKRVKLQRIDTPEQVAVLVNLDIFVAKNQLPQLSSGEYYWHQLQDLSVYLHVQHAASSNDNMQDKPVLLGTITEFMRTGANDVMVVLPTPDSVVQKKHLIPYIPGHTIRQVDLDQRLVWVDWFLDY